MSAGPDVIPHSRPTLEDEDIQALIGVAQSGQVAQGPRVEEFERAMAAFVGVDGAVAVASGSVALELALVALGVGTGDEVIMPSYVCAAPLLAARRVGATPRLVDIHPETYALLVGQVEQAISPRTKALIVVHPFGLAIDLTPFQSFHIPIVEDCAATLGVGVNGRLVGRGGTVAICSFYATKLLCTGEGGMVMSDDPALVDRARKLRGYDEAPTLDHAAFNRKMTDLAAGLGLAQLRRLRGFIARREAVAALYHEALADVDVRRPIIPPGQEHAYHRFIVGLNPGAGGTGSERLETVLRRMERRGIQCRRPVFRPLHRYLDLEGFPETERVHQTAVSLPIYPSLGDQDVARVAEALREELG